MPFLSNVERRQFQYTWQFLGGSSGSKFLNVSEG